MNEALKKAQKTYSAKCKILTVRINRETEPDLIEWLEKNEGSAGTKIKELIRQSM
jgi:oligoribonuclease NrnB/cAMP/cGMP phosphodiesterase (DHH superfamily)